MKRAFHLLIFFFFLTHLPHLGRPQSFDADTTAPDDWRSALGLGKEVTTHLHFFFHDILSGPNPSAVPIINSTTSSPTQFGLVTMIDDPLTAGPDPASQEVGRAQGLYGSAGRDGLSLLMAMDFHFTQGRYNGSSFSLLSRNPALNPVREMAVVGGTGLFRLARGIAIARTNWFNITTGDAIVEYNVTLVHNEVLSTVSVGSGGGGGSGSGGASPKEKSGTNEGSSWRGRQNYVLTFLLIIFLFLFGPSSYEVASHC